MSTKADTGPDYKKTLNLPKTSFPMKANLVQNEPASQKRWDKAGLYARLLEQRAGRERYVFHDGPPYANGSIHMGHMLNKCLKDFVVRTRLMEGLDCPFVPGWDCHGLPIEHRVMQDLGKSGKLDKIAALEDGARRMAIRRECHAYASKQVKHQSKQMQRLLTLGDYADPYLTMTPAYEGATIEVFASLVEKGLVYRQLKAVHWSIANETALADAELEYQEREDISVYVDFEAEDASAVYDAFGLSEDDRPDQSPTFMIWTTTPWTLPANLAIAVHESFEYALVRVDGNVSILAKELIETVCKLGKVDDPEILATTTGEKLAGLRYKHPFVDSPDWSHLPDAAMRHAETDGIYRVVIADYVTLEDGTGLVHTAPGHGSEDYMTGLREKLPVYCPVRADGTYDDSTPEFLRGVNIWDANEQITEHIRASGHLFHDHRFLHSYPHDWRSKTPVIFRATEQWFIGVDEAFDGGGSLRERAFEVTDSARSGSVEFMPEWGRNRMRGMLESRPDWCISRQRSWGLPIPAFYTPDDQTLLNTDTVRAVAKRFREAGSDAWFTEDPATLLQHWDNPDNIDLSTLRKGHDIFDVWFESGSSWNSVMRERSDGADYPIDLYLEGSDQHRGWFQLSMLPALGMTGRAPYERILTHGFIVDKDGKKMSKSGGNALDVDELVQQFGADVCRWWVATTSYENDIRVDLEFFKTAGEAYRKVRNTLRFMLSNLSDVDAGAPNDTPAPESIDAWALGELDALSELVREAYRGCHFARAAQAIYNFANDTMSATYLAAVKDRLYCDRPDSLRRRRTQRTLFTIADALSRLIAPILPHTADEAYRALRNIEPKEGETCVHLDEFLPPTGATPHDGWEHVMTLRDAALKALEDVRASGEIDNPLDAGMVVPNAGGALGAFDPVDLADLLGVSRVQLDADAEVPRVLDLKDEPRCERSWKRDGTVSQRSDGGMLSDRDAEAVGVA
ncbi:MAG: isoleucine--tRNA ligase [Planctomycetota bacterium]